MLSLGCCVGFSLVVASRDYSSLQCTGFSLWAGFFCCEAQAPGHVGFSSCGTWALEHRLNSCGTWAMLLQDKWDLPRSGIEPVSLDLAWGFFSTEPPGKPQTRTFLSETESIFYFVYFCWEYMAVKNTMTTSGLVSLSWLMLVVSEKAMAPHSSTCLENPMDGEAWKAAVHEVAKSRTWLSDFTFTFHFHALEKEMATHSSVLAWRIPGTGKPGGLPSMGSHRVGHDWSDLAAAASSFIHDCFYIKIMQWKWQVKSKYY